MKKNIEKICKGLAGILLMFILAFGILILVLTVREYKPEAEEVLPVEKKGAIVKAGETLKLLSWNIGYGGLGDNADFFMDGGKSVKSSDQARVKENLQEIGELLDDVEPDIVLLQEVDKNSARSYHIDESGKFAEGWKTSLFAANFKVDFIPYPVPPIGKVYSGIQTLSQKKVSQASRLQLPVPFSWPTRIANLKRCLLLSRMPVEASGKELVVVNLHLEAYDDGSGKEAQTKQLFKILEEEREKGNYVIAGGDFNQTFSSAESNHYHKKEGVWQPGELSVENIDRKHWQFCMDGRIPTCRSLDIPLAGADKKSFQFYLIDGFIVSSNVKVESCRTLDQQFKYADHNPVLMKVELR